MKILHLSDLHFGYDKDDTMKSIRSNLFRSLKKSIRNVCIDLLMITGDITWQCKEDGYAEAEKWITDFLKEINLSNNKVLVCPGNHDLDHGKCIDMEYQSNMTDVDKSLRQERIDALSERFHKYVRWCEKIGVCKYKLGDKENYLTGIANINGIDFWGLNSAWYAFNGGSEDKGKLWIGNNFIDVLINQSAGRSSRLKLALMHHPYEWINENETLTFRREDKSLFSKLADNVLCVFSGHTHAIQGPPNKFSNKLYCFGTGATYVGKTYNNCFCMYDINDEHKGMQYTPFITQSSSWAEALPETIELVSSETTRNMSPVMQGSESIERDSETFLKKSLSENGFNLIHVNATDFPINRTIIWPVVPRLNLNNIHLAQLELMELLNKQYGWKIKTIISNCGAKPLSLEDTDGFIQKVRQRCEKINISNIDFELLRNFFDDNQPAISNEILRCFIKVSSELHISALNDIKGKKYDEQKKSEIQQQPVLDYILPVLQYAVIKQISDDIWASENKKSIIIAGNDEKDQWTKAIEIIGDSKIGAILIPELNSPEGENVSQDTSSQDIRSVIRCSSREDLKEALKKDSFAQWFYRMFVFLSNYKDPSKVDIFTCTSAESVRNSSIWRETQRPDIVDLDKLLDSVWSRIEREEK